MSGGLEPGPLVSPVTIPDGHARAAAVHVADRIARQHPTELDDLMPRLAGRNTAHNPQARADLLELLDALGLNGDTA